MRSLALLCCAITIAAAAQCRPDAHTSPATTIASLQILGAGGTSAGEIREIAQEFSGKPFYASSELRELIREGFQDRGYYKVQVSEPEIHPVRDHSRDQVFAVVNVNEGLRYRIQFLAFSYRKEVLTAEQMRALFPIQPGDWYSISKLREGVGRLNDAFRDRGYINFIAVPRIESYDRFAALSINFDIESGEQFAIRSVRVIGGTPDLQSRVTEEGKKLEGAFLSSAVSERIRKLGDLCPERQMTVEKNDADRAIDLVFDLDRQCPTPGCV